MDRQQLKDTIYAAAAKHGLDPSLFFAQLQHESANFDPKVLNHTKVSSAGAFGIGQFMPGTGAEYGIKKGSVNIAAEIDASALYMQKLTKQFGDQRTAQQAYNTGPGNMKKILAGEKKMPAETAAYNGHIDKLLAKSGGANLVGSNPTPPAVSSTTAQKVAEAMPQPDFQQAMPTQVAEAAPQADWRGQLAAQQQPVAQTASAQLAAQQQPVAQTASAQPEQSWDTALQFMALNKDANRIRDQKIMAMLGGNHGAQDPAHAFDLPDPVNTALDNIVEDLA